MRAHAQRGPRAALRGCGRDVYGGLYRRGGACSARAMTSRWRRSTQREVFTKPLGDGMKEVLGDSCGMPNPWGMA